MHAFTIRTMNAQSYLDEVIRPLVTSKMKQFGAQVIFVHDSVLYHRASIVSRELNVSSIIRLLDLHVLLSLTLEHVRKSDL